MKALTYKWIWIFRAVILSVSRIIGLLSGARMNMSDMVSPFSASFLPFSLAYLKRCRNESEAFSQPCIRRNVYYPPKTTTRPPSARGNMQQPDRAAGAVPLTSSFFHFLGERCNIKKKLYKMANSMTNFGS